MLERSRTGAGANLNRTQLEEIRSNLSEAENKIAKILSVRCKLTEAEVRSLFAQGETKDTSFALHKGIIQSVRDPQITADAPFLTLNFG